MKDKRVRIEITCLDCSKIVPVIRHGSHRKRCYECSDTRAHMLLLARKREYGKRTREAYRLAKVRVVQRQRQGT